jgi:hypothetical protein
MLPLRESKASPLNVKSVKLKVSADDVVAMVRAGATGMNVASL